MLRPSTGEEDATLTETLRIVGEFNTQILSISTTSSVGGIGEGVGSVVESVHPVSIIKPIAKANSRRIYFTE